MHELLFLVQLYLQDIYFLNNQPPLPSKVNGSRAQPLFCTLNLLFGDFLVIHCGLISFPNVLFAMKLTRSGNEIRVAVTIDPSNKSQNLGSTLSTCLVSFAPDSISVTGQLHDPR